MAKMTLVERLTKGWNGLRFLYRTRLGVPSAIHSKMRRICQR